MPTVAESLVKTLADAGVKLIYGIVGDSLNGIIDAIRREKSIEWIQRGIHDADGRHIDPHPDEPAG